MIHTKLFCNDAKQIMRDPVMIALMLAPLLLILAFKAFEIWLFPYMAQSFNIYMDAYSAYILSFIILMSAGMLGIVVGFVMLDDKDANTLKLMEITPLGRSGYLFNRLALAVSFSVMYCFIVLLVFKQHELPIYAQLMLLLLSSIYTAIIGLLIFYGSDDKVKGLTFAKGLNILSLFAFADLFALKWLTILAWFFPPYWLTMLIKSPNSISIHALAVLVHMFWLSVLIFKFKKSE